MSNENQKNMTNETPEKNNIAVEPVSETYVMYPEAVIVNIISQLNTVNVSGLDNISKISNVYQALSTQGKKIPVNVG